MSWLSDYQDQQRAEAKKKAAANGEPGPSRRKPKGPAPESAPGDWELPGEHPDYLATAVVDELTKLANTDPGGRNHQLYISAKALGQFEDVDRDWLRGKLREACEENGHTADDGARMVTGTIKSGFVDADTEVDDHGWRDPCGPDGGPTVTVVGSLSSSPPTSKTNSTSTTAPVASSTASAAAPSASPLEPVMARIVAAEQDFWDRPCLRRIFDAALMQMVPPWALLAHCCGRAIALIHPNIHLPGVIGGSRGSLNWFAAVVAESGGGKSAASDLSEELVPSRTDPADQSVQHPIERNIGSGEGIIHAFVKTPARTGKNAAPPEFHKAILLNADEIDTVTSMDIRSGSTTLPILRQAFTGTTLGFAYAKATNNYHLPKHTYRLVFMLSGQPSRYGSLLADHRGGTPQRFQWFPAFDLRIVDVPQVPGSVTTPLILPTVGDWQRMGVEIVIPDDAKRLIRTTRVAVSHGTAGSLNSHEVFVRVKFAAGLAVLDGRTDMTVDDWRLAGIAMDVSRITRDWVQERLAGVEDEEDTHTGKRRAVVADATDIEKARRKRERDQMAYDRVLAGIRRNLTRPRSEGDLKRIARRELSHLVRRVLLDMERDGEVEQCTLPHKSTICWRFASKRP